jgi:hypothetical protein
MKSKNYNKNHITSADGAINKDNIFLRKSTKEKIRRILTQAWRKDSLIEKNTKFVSYKEFVAKLNKLSEYIDLYIDEHSDQKTYIRKDLYSIDKKSDDRTWEHISRNIQHEVTSIDSVDEQRLESSIIICDDAWYSGGHILASIWSATNFKKPEEKRNIIIAVPYISLKTLVKLERYWRQNTRINIIIPDCVEIVEMYDEEKNEIIVDKKNIDQRNPNLKTLLIFEHKKADDESLPQSLIKQTIDIIPPYRYENRFNMTKGKDLYAEKENTIPKTASRDDIENNSNDYTQRKPIRSFLSDELVPDEKNETYIYRWIPLDNVASLKKIIYNEGMSTDKSEDGEICFTSWVYKNIAVKYAGLHNGLSVIFQIPIQAIKDKKIPISWWWDKIPVAWDIPPEIIQQSHIFLINYKHNCLTKIDLTANNTFNHNTDKIADILLQNNPETTNTAQDENPTNKKYNAVHIAKTGRKAVSHGANRIPWGPGSAKMGIEAIVGKTLWWEKLSPTQQKLYGRWSALSLIWWGLGRLGVHTGHLRLGLPLPVLSALSSAVAAAAQASVVWWDSNIGKIFKEKMKDYLETITKYIQKIKGNHIDQQTQEQITAVEASIEEVENIINETTDVETADMIKEIIVDLPANKSDGK